MKIEKLELTQEDLDKIYNTDQTFWFHSGQTKPLEGEEQVSELLSDANGVERDKTARTLHSPCKMRDVRRYTCEGETPSRGINSQQVLASPSFPAGTSYDGDDSKASPEEVHSPCSSCPRRHDIVGLSSDNPNEGENPSRDANIPLGVEKQDQSYTDCLFPVSPLPPFSSSERKPSTPEDYVVNSVWEWVEIDDVERWYFER